MSILQEYEEIKKSMGSRKYNAIEQYLEDNPNLLLSDVLYKRQEYEKFDEWYKQHINEIKVDKKPKCALIGHNGNIFNLMGIVSRTLKSNGMSVESKEMVERVTHSTSYDNALNILSQYVDIVGDEELDYEEEY